MLNIDKSRRQFSLVEVETWPQLFKPLSWSRARSGWNTERLESNQTDAESCTEGQVRGRITITSVVTPRLVMVSRSFLVLILRLIFVTDFFSSRYEPSGSSCILTNHPCLVFHSSFVLNQYNYDNPCDSDSNSRSLLSISIIRHSSWLQRLGLSVVVEVCTH